MTVESVLSLDFTCSGKSESFFGTGVSFNFWHFVNYLIINVIAAHYAARCNLFSFSESFVEAFIQLVQIRREYSLQ